MAMSPKEQMLLRMSLEKVSKAFFKQADLKKGGILKVGKQAAVKEDAFGLLAVLAHWAGDIIHHAPKDMQDNMFMAFADSVVEVAGIKDEKETEERVTQ